MGEILKELLFAPLQLKLISYSKEQQVFNTYVFYLTATKAPIFPKLSEIYLTANLTATSGFNFKVFVEFQFIFSH